MDTKVIFPTQTYHLQKPKQLSPLEHESCREVIESLTSENAKRRHSHPAKRKVKVRTKQNPFIQISPV